MCSAEPVAQVQAVGRVNEKAASMPEPSCPMGYTRDDLAKHFGVVVGEPHPLWTHLRGQTQMICDGRFYDHDKREYYPSPCADHPHGTVTYVWDVADWVKGRPVWD